MVCMAHGLHNRCAFAAVQTLRLMLSCEDPNSTRCIAILIVKQSDTARWAAKELFVHDVCQSFSGVQSIEWKL